MATYTVHQPPLKKYEDAPDPARFVFVRDGFSFWAFLLGPLWMLRHRMWLVLVGYLLGAIALVLALRFVEAPPGTAMFAAFMVALLVGMEAGTLRRFTLARRRWANVGVIVGDNREAAERRFFDSWTGSEMLVPLASLHPVMPKGAMPKPPVPPVPNPSASTPDVIGLFPEPGARR